MAIVQISKIQVRSGSLVDLPQLDEAEFGWASDDKRLFIGKTTPNENVEVLTSYSQLNFSQIVGSYGNLDIANTVANGEILTFDGANWVNRGGSAGGLISLGDISNVQIDGGAIGYIMETDGAGNLAWTPKGTLYTAITNFHPTTFTGSIAEATITAGSFVIGQTYQIKTIGSTPTDFTLIGAASNAIGVVFTATGTGASNGDGTAYLTTLTVTAVSSGYIGVNSAIQTSGMTITSGTYVVSQITGTAGLVGTYYLNKHHTLSSTTIYGPLLMQVANTVPYTNGTEISISGVQGVSNATVNGLTFYLSITANYASSGNVALYTDFARVVPTNGTTVTYTNAPNAIATAQIGSGSGGAGAIGGSNGMVQFNSSGIFNGDSGFTFNLTAPKTLTVDGNFNISNVVASNTISATQFISNIAIGTPPLIITSTTLVPNLYVARANVSDNDVVTTQTTGTFFPTFVNSSSTGNLAMGSNANLSFNAATGNLSTTLLNVTSNANVGNLGTAGRIIATGNITGGNLITAGFANVGTNANIGTTLSVIGNANVGNLGTAGVIIATGNITGGNLITAGFANVGTNANIGTTLSVIGNANVGNLGTAGVIIATGNITGGNFITAGFANVGTNANIGTTLSVIGNANVGNLGTAGVIIATGNITGGNFITAGFANVGANANIGTTLSVIGNANVGNLGTAGLIIATGNITGGNFITAGFANIGTTLSVIGNANVGNLGTATAIITTGNITTINSGLMQNGNSNVTLTANGNISTTVVGNTVLVVTGTGVNVAGTLNATGNVSAPFFIGNVQGNISGNFAVAGSNTDVIFNYSGNANASAAFKFDYAANVLTVIGNIVSSGASNVFSGNGSALTALNASNISSGTLPQPRLANANVILGSTALTLGSTVTAVAGLANLTFSGTTSGTIQFLPAAVAGTGTVLTMPATTGTVITTGDSNTVTNTMLAGSIINAKLANSSLTVNGTSISLGGSGTVTATATNALTIGSGLGGVSYNGSAAVTITNSGVTALTTSSGLSTNTSATGAVSVTNTGVTSLANGGGITASASTGAVTLGSTATNLNTASAIVARDASGNFSAGTITANLSGTITTNTITTGSNVTAGTITGNWSLSAGSRLNATYADLAEYYEADAAYEPGTVLEFGGDKEVTIAEDSTIKVAGVVSTNPAYIMNSLCLGTHTVAIALQGRVPTKVRGKIRKGDMLISGGNGFARPAKTSPMMGTVIGKALENFDGEGVIEVAISRM